MRTAGLTRKGGFQREVWIAGFLWLMCYRGTGFSSRLFCLTDGRVNSLSDLQVETFLQVPLALVWGKRPRCERLSLAGHRSLCIRSRRTETGLPHSYLGPHPAPGASLCIVSTGVLSDELNQTSGEHPKFS